MAKNLELTGRQRREKDLTEELAILISQAKALNKNIDPEFRKKVEETEKKLIANMNGEEITEKGLSFLLGTGIKEVIKKLFIRSNVAAAAIVAPFKTTRIGYQTKDYHDAVERVARVKKMEERAFQIVMELQKLSPPKIGVGVQIDKAAAERAKRAAQSKYQCPI